jgi:DNA-binding NtrC family response regulator
MRLPRAVNLQQPECREIAFGLKRKLIYLQEQRLHTTLMKEQFRSRQQLANELGISTRTLSRKLSALQINIPPGLIAPRLYTQILEKIRD